MGKCEWCGRLVARVAVVEAADGSGEWELCRTCQIRANRENVEVERRADLKREINLRAEAKGRETPYPNVYR